MKIIIIIIIVIFITQHINDMFNSSFGTPIIITIFFFPIYEFLLKLYDLVLYLQHNIALCVGSFIQIPGQNILMYF
jgi:hypothetical protein